MHLFSFFSIGVTEILCCASRWSIWVYRFYYSTETHDHRNEINICISCLSNRPVAVALVPVRRTNHLGRITKIIYCVFSPSLFLATSFTRLVHQRKDKPRSSKDLESTTCICIRHSWHAFIIPGRAKRCFLLLALASASYVAGFILGSRGRISECLGGP